MDGRRGYLVGEGSLWSGKYSFPYPSLWMIGKSIPLSIQCPPPDPVLSRGCSHHPLQSEALGGGGDKDHPSGSWPVCRSTSGGHWKLRDAGSRMWVSIARGQWCPGMSPSLSMGTVGGTTLSTTWREACSICDWAWKVPGPLDPS